MGKRTRTPLVTPLFTVEKATFLLRSRLERIICCRKSITLWVTAHVIIIGEIIAEVVSSISVLSVGWMDWGRV